MQRQCNLFYMTSQVCLKEKPSEYSCWRTMRSLNCKYFIRQLQSIIGCLWMNKIKWALVYDLILLHALREEKCGCGKKALGSGGQICIVRWHKQVHAGQLSMGSSSVNACLWKSPARSDILKSQISGLVRPAWISLQLRNFSNFWISRCINIGGNFGNCWAPL